MKITEQTTLAELAIERARLGISELHIKIGTDGNRVCSALGPTSGAQCSAKTEAEAIDKVFRRIESADVLPSYIMPVGQLMADDYGNVKPARAPLPPGEYKATTEGDPFGPRTATISEGEHVGKTVHIPTPKDKP